MIQLVAAAMPHNDINPNNISDSNSIYFNNSVIQFVGK